MNKKLVLAIFVLLVLGFFLKSTHHTPKQNSLQNTGPIIAFGDSLVYGFGSTEGNDFVSLLSQRIGVPIINAGIPRHTSADLLARIQTDVLNLHPRVVIVVVGGNDYLHQVPKDIILANVQSIIAQIKATGAQIILVGISDLVYSNDYQTLAKEEGIYFVPHVMDRMFNNRQLMSDMFHPNDAGYKIFADQVEPYLLQALQ